MYTVSTSSSWSRSSRSRHSVVRGLDGESAFDTTGGFACYRTVRLQVLTAIERLLLLSHGTAGTVHGPRTGTVRQLW